MMVTDHKILSCDTCFLVGTHFIVPDMFQTRWLILDGTAFRRLLRIYSVWVYTLMIDIIEIYKYKLCKICSFY